MNEDRVEARLAELARRTAAVRARAGFRERVVAAALALESERAFARELARSAARFLPLALACAALAVGWAAQAERVTSAEVAAAELGWELDW